MKVELDADIVDHITLQGLKGLKKTYKELRDTSYTSQVPMFEYDRDTEFAFNQVMLDAIKLVASNLELGRDTDKLFYELAKSCAELGETYK
jgi:hypothetical protein